VLGVGGMAASAQVMTPVNESVKTAGAPATAELDPASQRQTSLLEAASRDNRPVAKDLVLGDGTPRKAVEATRDMPAVGNKGCVPQYGKEGQCLPLVPPSQTAHAGHVAPQQLTRLWTCSEVRTLFPDGLPLGEADPLNLDTNKDRIACGAGDRA
jgi:hypothetical protein